jgi:flagellar hook-associated protein 2
MEVGSVTYSGLISGLDISTIIAQLAQIRQRPIAVLQAKQARYTQTLTVYQQLTARLMGLSAACPTLDDGTAFQAVTVSSSDQDIVVATGSAGAAVGQYQIAVSQLAQHHKISSATVADSSAALGHSGDIVVNGKTVTIGADDSLVDLRAAINAAGAGVTATILTVSDTDHRLILTSLSSGQANAMDLVDANASDILESLGLQTSATSIKSPITDGAAGDYLSGKTDAVATVMGLSDPVSGTIKVNGTDVAIDLASDSLEDIAAAIDAVENVTATVTSTGSGTSTTYRVEIVGDSGTPTFTDANNVLVTLGVLAKGIADEIDAAQDASFTIDGVGMTRSSNAVDDAIENVQLQLLAKTSGSPVTVTVAANTQAAASAIGQFVNYYNQVIDLINANQEFDSDTNQGGALFGSTTVLSMEADLRQMVTGLVNTLGQDTILASMVGITTDEHDRLVFDSGELLDALESDPVGVRRLFGLYTEVTNSEIEYYSSTAATRDSGPDGYAINITQVASRPTAISAELASGITMDETLTIGGYQVTLTNGMSLQDAADLLNSLFSAHDMAMDATVEGDTIKIEHEVWGDSHQIEIESSLDDGSGGTDLGGATAGEIETYTGQDVAGTINGEECTGSGRLLTGAEGNENTAGLMVLVTSTSTGDKGVMKVSKGIASRLSDYLSIATDEAKGSITVATDGVNDEIDAIDDEIAALNEDVDRYIERLQVDFARMEEAMSQSLSLLDWLTMQMDYLPGWQSQRGSSGSGLWR